MILRIAVFYVLTWFFLILLGGSQQAIGLIPPEIGLAQLAPGMAALLMLVLFRKDRHQIVFLKKGISFSLYLYAALIPAGVSLVVLLIRSFMDITPSATTPVYSSLIAFLLWMPFGALGEEIGWRGYLHKKLDTRLRGVFSSLWVGILWMPVHVAFLTQGPVFILFLTILIISYSIVIYALVHDSGFNVMLASIFHLSVNLTNLLFLDVIYELSFMIVNSLVWAVLAAGLVVLKQELFLKPKS